MRKKSTIYIIATIIFLMLIGCESVDYGKITEKGKKLNHYLQITQEKAKEMMDEYSGYVIVDVRTREEYEEGHIPGAICIPNEEITDTKPEELPDLAQILFIYCRSGRRSKEAAQKLSDIGYENVYEFGGIIDWTGDVVKEYADKAKREVKNQIKEGLAEQDGSAEPGILTGVDDVALTDLTGAGTDYAFIYDGTPFSAQYSPDNWEIRESYKITNAMDMAIICQALINEHPIHGKDMVSYRTCDDMAYEWVQHNIAYSFLPEDSKWMESVKNVDFDPKDQGKSYRDLYEDRTGKKFDIPTILD